MRNPVTCHSSHQMRIHARSLNPRVCAVLVSPDANCLRRRCCARLRMPNIGGATDLLAATVRRGWQTGFGRSSTKIAVPCTSWPFASEAQLTVTSISVTTRRLGSFSSRLHRNASRWVPRLHQPSSPHQCLPARFHQPIVVYDQFNSLKPRAISGQMTTVSAAGACDMRWTGPASDAVFSHTAPQSCPCPFLRPEDDVQLRTHDGRFTTTPETALAPNASVDHETSDYLSSSHPRSQASSTIQRREKSAPQSSLLPNGRQSPLKYVIHDAHARTAVGHVLLTNSLPHNAIGSFTSLAPVTPMFRNQR